jgi:hypothetical protein
MNDNETILKNVTKKEQHFWMPKDFPLTSPIISNADGAKSKTEPIRICEKTRMMKSILRTS